ncbi:hypothetical protein BHE74_00035982 [Ensete ventricosum]|nr:hypothetical protein BHE74_00035982 [Ensete ventricosum]
MVHQFERSQGDFMSYKMMDCPRAMLHPGVTQEWVDDGELPSERTKNRRWQRPYDVAQIRLREPDKLEDKTDSDDTVGSRRKFTKRFTEGIRKLTGNAKGDRRKEDRRTYHKIARGYRNMWEFIEGIRKLAWNTPGDHRKKTRRLCRKLSDWRDGDCIGEESQFSKCICGGRTRHKLFSKTK